MKLLWIAPLFVLAACSTAPQPVPDVPLVAQKTEVVVPPELIAPCGPLTPLSKTSYNQGETLDVLKGWFNQYSDCSARFSKFVGIVKPALNIKENAGDSSK